MKKIIIVAVAVITVVGGVSAALYFLMPNWLPESVRSRDPVSDTEASQHETENKRGPEVGADLEVFVVNLAGTGTGRYLRTTLSLGVKDEHEKEHIKEFTGPIRHAVIMFLSEKKVEELLDPEGKSKLRSELHKQINAAIGKKMVTNVYFKEFLIQ